MPELPEVQTTATSLKPLLGQTVSKITVFQPKLRWQVPDDIHTLKNAKLIDIKRRAKYLILTFKLADNSDRKLLIHLGMSGSLQQHKHSFIKRKHDHLIMYFEKTGLTTALTTQLHYHDPRRFGMVLWLDEYQDKLIDKLGIEPLEDDFDGQYLYDYIHKRKKPITRPIKAVIMEQQIVVGVGNIYATESLFLAGIHPLQPADSISLEDLTNLVGFIRQILQTSIEKGGSTLKDFTVADGQTGYFQQTLLVYGKQGEPCPHCGTMIEGVKIAQRASTFCPICQPFIQKNAETTQ